MKRPKQLNEKGQVAIFVALIFQVLFLFFAMVVNVGLLVHHKINLQNSVDIAAYYGASKQAEMLNAIGHVNYQIRQSWKLLTFRYRQLGTAGLFSVAHPFDKIKKEIVPPDDEDINTDPEFDLFYNRPAFCITYVPFKPMAANETTCKFMNKSYNNIPLFKPPTITAPFLGISRAVRTFSENLLSSITESCKTIGARNYIMLSRFVAAYSLDQADRKRMIIRLAGGLSNSLGGGGNQGEDFVDLEGASASAGMRQTFEKNLTRPNKEGIIDFKTYNSLASAECGSPQSNGVPRWLSEVRIQPMFVYVDTTCNNKEIITESKFLYDQPTYSSPPDIPSDVAQQIEYLKDFVAQDPQPPYNYSVGYEKNPWCMAYVGVKATSKPKIPFSPLGSVELKARAYAKPFGGKIGPWYGSRWDAGAEQSSNSKSLKVDALLPPRADDLAGLGQDLNDPGRFANYSKYPGDKFGLKSRRTLGQFGRAIFNMDASYRNSPANLVDQLPGEPTPDDANAPHYGHWNHVGLPFTYQKEGDILAWDTKTGKINPMRELEMVAIAPDIFDISYYSIEPDFYNVYLKRIKDGILKNISLDFLPRADLGSRIGDPDLEGFTINDQMDVVKKISNSAQPMVNLEDKLEYVVFKSRELSPQVNPLLTSWVSKTIGDYRFDQETFAKCTATPLKEGPTSGNCVGPGRSGYSVKIVSDSYLRANQIDIGGKSTSGLIKNPPPSDF